MLQYEVALGTRLGMHCEVQLSLPDPSIFMSKSKWTVMGSLVAVISLSLGLFSLQIRSPQ